MLSIFERLVLPLLVCQTFELCCICVFQHSVTHPDQSEKLQAAGNSCDGFVQICGQALILQSASFAFALCCISGQHFQSHSILPIKLYCKNNNKNEEVQKGLSQTDFMTYLHNQVESPARIVCFFFMVKVRSTFTSRVSAEEKLSNLQSVERSP